MSKGSGKGRCVYNGQTIMQRQELKGVPNHHRYRDRKVGEENFSFTRSSYQRRDFSAGRTAANLKKKSW